MKLKRINSYQFDWLKWTGRSIHNLGLQCRYEDIIANKNILCRYVVGFCKGENLQCRPKVNTVAIMCFYNKEYFWFHITLKEFQGVFGYLP